jgi:hypothetical protein
METQGREPVRAGPDLGGGEPGGVARQILARLLKSVERGREQGIDLR